MPSAPAQHEATRLQRRQVRIAVLAVVGIAVHLAIRFGLPGHEVAGVPLETWPLLVVLACGGVPLVLDLLQPRPPRVRLRPAGRHLDRHLGVLGEYLAGALVVLMLSGGEALEAYAVRSASSVLEALARRMPAVAAPTAAGGAVADVAAGRGRGRRRAGRLPARDLPGRRHGRRGPRRDGRVVPHRRAVPDVQGAGLGGAVRGDQRRRRP